MLAPDFWAIRFSPLNNNNVGTLVIENCFAVAVNESTFILAIDILSDISFDISSIIGSKPRQGAHHGAQKSINTGLSEFFIKSENSASLISFIVLSYCVFICLL